MESNSTSQAPFAPVIEPGPSGRGGARRGSWTLVGVILLLSLGTGLRSVQYFSGVDMWHDELAVARNIEDHGLVQLLTAPLDHHQVAPIGSLALFEGSASLFGVSEKGLRFGPWILGLLALFLFWRVATRFADGLPLLAALGVFAVSPAMVWYGSSLKPYGGDVAVSLLLVWSALRYAERPDDLGRGLAAGALGAVAILMSFPAVPTAAILAAVLAVRWWRQDPRPPLAPLAGLGTGWILAIAVAGWAALGLLDPATDTFMRDFWAEDFPPTQPWAALTWAFGKLHAVSAHLLVFFPPRDPLTQLIVALPMALAVVGLVVGFRRRTLVPALLLAPPAAGLSAAFLHLLPFDHRLGLHATWPLLVLAAAGLTGLRGVLPGRWRAGAHALAVLMGLPLVVMVLLTARPPYSVGRGAQPRSVLTDLAERRRPTDRIYVYTQGRHDMAFYGTRAGIDGWTQGDRHYDDPRGYLREIDALRGDTRVWFFWVRLDRDEPALIRSYLEAIGREVERIPDEEAAFTGAVLYDLSDAERSSHVSAESFAIPDLEER